MKSESSIILNANKSKVVFAILTNTLFRIGDFYLFFDDIKILDNQCSKQVYDDEIYQIFSVKYVLNHFEIFLEYINRCDKKFMFAIFDDFSSYIKMYEDFELTGDNFCYNFTFYDNVRYNTISQIQDHMIDMYYFIDNAYTLDITTTLKNGEYCIFEDLSQMLGFRKTNDFNTEQKNTYTNLLNKK